MTTPQWCIEAAEHLWLSSGTRTMARMLGAEADEEAERAAFVEATAMIIAGHAPDITHLLDTGGAIACGERNPRCSSDINDVTCPDCAAEHAYDCARAES